MPVRVLSFESRRSDEIRSLIENFGGEATVAPSMREVPLGENAEVLEFAEDLFAGKFDILVLMTGVGTRYLAEVIETRWAHEELLDRLRRTTLAIRGPKPAAVLKEWDVPWQVRAPEPNTWRELLAAMRRQLELGGKRIAVQEYGQSNEEFLQALRAEGADVRAVTVYRWALPEDVGPLEGAVRESCESGFDVVLFTSAQQVRHVLQVAESLGLKDQWLAAAGAAWIASIGPTCSEALVECGLRVDFEASPPKMGHLVRGALSSRQQ